jgi:hypothetical protein
MEAESQGGKVRGEESIACAYDFNPELKRGSHSFLGASSHLFHDVLESSHRQWRQTSFDVYFGHHSCFLPAVAADAHHSYYNESSLIVDH